MSSDNHDLNRAAQQDARLVHVHRDEVHGRQAADQLTARQGFLGDRVSARDLIGILNDHPLVGADDGDPILGDNGYYSDDPWSFNGGASSSRPCSLTCPACSPPPPRQTPQSAATG